MATVKYKYGLSNNISTESVDDGTIYICVDTADVYADLNNSRLQLSSNVSCEEKLIIKILTEDEYNALSVIDESTLYIVTGG